MAGQNSQQRRRNAPPKKNVVHKGQRAVLNGKPVVADGNGNWKSIPKGSAGNGIYTGSTAGSYKKGEDRKSTPTKTKPTKPTTKGNYTVSGVTYDSKTGRAQAFKDGKISSNGYSIKDGKRTNGHTAPAAPKPKPAPTPTPTKTKPAKPAATSTKTTPAKRKPRTWLADNYKPGGPPKAKESLQIKPKKKKLTNKQRKQGGFH